MKKTLPKVVKGAFVLFGLLTSIHAQTPVWNYSTGQGASGIGQVDSSASGSYVLDWADEWGGFGNSSVYAVAPINDWHNSAEFYFSAAPEGSQWTSFSNNAATGDAGSFTFIYNFANTTDLTSGILDMAYKSWGGVTNIVFNGQSIYSDSLLVGSGADFTPLYELSSSVILAANNVLEVTVKKDSTPQWFGLAGNFSVTEISTVTPIPEPSISILSIIGVTCFVIGTRNRRRN